MTARPLFYVIALAFVCWLVWAVRAPGGEPTPPTVSGPEPAPEPPTTTVKIEKRVQGKNAAQWHKVAGRYRRTLQAVVRRPSPVGDHPLERAFQCVHSGEGAWSSRTGNGYYGGLQMDMAFQRAYGPEFLRAFGTANNWPRSVQITVGIRAYLSGRGFYPWPNTARMCGLIK